MPAVIRNSASGWHRSLTIPSRSSASHRRNHCASNGTRGRKRPCLHRCEAISASLSSGHRKRDRHQEAKQRNGWCDCGRLILPVQILWFVRIPISHRYNYRTDDIETICSFRFTSAPEEEKEEEKPERDKR